MDSTMSEAPAQCTLMVLSALHVAADWQQRASLGTIALIAAFELHIGDAEHHGGQGVLGRSIACEQSLLLKRAENIS